MAENSTAEGRIAYKWLAMISVAMGSFMSALDSSIVNVSWPTIMTSLHTDRATVQWVVAVYLLVITGLLLTLGRIADLRGRRPIYILGFVVFTLGSALCGLSRSIYLLIAFRVLQGIGAAMLMANGPAIITDAFPRTERGKALGLLSTMVAAGLMTGPALGGLLIHVGGWPLIFLVNIPVGIVGVTFSMRVLRREAKGYEHHFDIPGAVLLLLALVSVTLALNEGPEMGWSSPFILAMLAAFVVFGVVFVLRERLTVHPVIDLALFKNKLFTAASVSALIAYVAAFTVTFQMPFYMSRVLRYSTEHMGLMLSVVPLTTFVIAPLSGMLSDRIGSRFLGSLGLAITSAALLMIGFLGAHPTAAHIILAFILTGIGTAIFQAPNNSTIMGSVPQNMLGVASGMLATMRNLGMVAAVAISGAVYDTTVRASLATGMDETPAAVRAFRYAFAVAAAVSAVGVFTSAMKGASVARPEEE